MKRSMVSIALAVILVVYGCDSPTSSSGGASLTFAAMIRSSAEFSKSSAETATQADVDSVRITRVRMLLRDIRFEAEEDSADYREELVIVDLHPEGGLEDVYTAAIPAGIYKRVRFKVHRIEEDDLRSVAPALRQQYDDFLAGERYSIIAEGVVYGMTTGMAGERFTYRSRLDEEQVREFGGGFVVEDNFRSTVSMTIDTGIWFRDTPGSLLDPRLEEYENTIDDNIRRSIELFGDNDRDGTDG